jgi:hypothetical protein
MSNTGFTVTSPDTSYSYAIQSGGGSVDGADSWNPDEYTSGDQYYGSITGRDEFSQFGRGVDTDFEGERIVGGGPNWDNGRGYIQIYDWVEVASSYATLGYGSGSWTSVQQIDGPVAGGWFGESVSMDYDGKRIIVGAPKVNTVYVYDYGSNGQFTLTQTITHTSSFGHCVSIAGDKADRFVVGAPNVNMIYIYEINASGQFIEVFHDSGANMINNVPVGYLNPGGRHGIVLYPEFNGYGYSVKMSAFGGHIVIGAPGTEIAEIQSSVDAGTTTPGTVSHRLGDHVISSTGPHYTPTSTNIAVSQINFGGRTSWACNTQVDGTGVHISTSHPHSAYAYPAGGLTAEVNFRGTTLGPPLRYNDGNGNLYHSSKSPWGFNNSENTAQDGFIFPNFQTGWIRILKCPDGGSWSTGQNSQVGGDIQGRNTDTHQNLSNWHCLNSSLPGFGRSVSISVDGKRVSAGSPGYTNSNYPSEVAHGDTRYFVFNAEYNSYDEPLVYGREYATSTYGTTARVSQRITIPNSEHDPDTGGPWSLLRKNGVWGGWNTSMSEDGSRLFIGTRESDLAIIPYDFSGTTFYPVSPIVRSGGQGSGPNSAVFGTTAPINTVLGGRGYLNGYRNIAHNGASCVVTHPAYPEAFGSTAGNFVFQGTGSGPNRAISNGEGRGILVIYRFTLTCVFRGNSLFEGYVKCDNLTIGSSGGAADHARLKFGGRRGENTTEASTTIESKWLGSNDNELLISKYNSDLNTPNDTVKDADWNKRDFFGDRVRIKAPKIEFQLQTPQTDQQSQKYRESPCMSITDMNSPFGGALFGPIGTEPRQLVLHTMVCIVPYQRTVICIHLHRVTMAGYDFSVQMDKVILLFIRRKQTH